MLAVLLQSSLLWPGGAGSVVSADGDHIAHECFTRFHVPILSLISCLRSSGIRACSIIESVFGFTLNLVSDSVKPACKSISIECLIIETGSRSVKWRR